MKREHIVQSPTIPAVSHQLNETKAIAQQFVVFNFMNSCVCNINCAHLLNTKSMSTQLIFA